MVDAPLRIGVLAVQGDFAEHAAMLRRAARDDGTRLDVREVRTPRDIAGLGGLIVPGGESTTIGKLLVAYGLEEPIKAAAENGLPVWGTCAGMILLARDIVGGEPDGRIGLMDLTVQRNAFGRQIDSFETDLDFVGLDRPIHAVFIRAPLVERVGPEAEALGGGEVPEDGDGRPHPGRVELPHPAGVGRVGERQIGGEEPALVVVAGQPQAEELL